MKWQWTFIFALVFALIIAVFSVINVEPVPVDFIFGSAQFPLIVVILGSALAGGLAVGMFGTFRMMGLHREIRILKRELQAAKDEASESSESSEASEASKEVAEAIAPPPADSPALSEGAPAPSDKE